MKESTKKKPVMRYEKDVPLLSDCPFCGSSNVTTIMSIGIKWVVGCNNCGCRTSEYGFSGDAVSAWNRRAALEDTCDTESSNADEEDNTKYTPF